VLLVLDVDHSPAVFPSTNRLAINDDVPLRSDDGEGDHILRKGGSSVLGKGQGKGRKAYANGLVELLVIILDVLSVEGVDANVVVGELRPDLTEREG
jgi:hypothetical protein